MKDGIAFGVSANYQPSSTEKVSVNMNIATLAQIDLLVDAGHYSNRSDFINEAVRRSLEQKEGTLVQLIDQKKLPENAWFLGIYTPERRDLERIAAKGDRMKIVGYGLLIIPEGMDEMVIANVDEIRVRGKIKCSQRIREHFGL